MDIRRRPEAAVRLERIARDVTGLLGRASCGLKLCLCRVASSLNLAVHNNERRIILVAETACGSAFTQKLFLWLRAVQHTELSIHSVGVYGRPFFLYS